MCLAVGGAVPLGLRERDTREKKEEQAGAGYLG